MLRETKELKGSKLGARDGEIGRIKDFYFDDEAWTVRYLVADTGTWLPGRQVLISPHAVKSVTTQPHKVVEVDLTKQQIEEGPPIEMDKPVSRQYEIEYYQYFNWPTYWSGPWEWGPVAYPGSFETDTARPAPVQRANERRGDPHLRSVSEVTHYTIQALNEQFGHVADLVLDDQTWTIRYLVADTRNWWPGKKVLLAPQWIAWMSWPEGRVYIDLDMETVKRGPAYDHSHPITREYETQLFSHYGREPYWETSAEHLEA
jgi:hypothetical protein